MTESTPIPSSATPAEGSARMPVCDLVELLQDVPLHSPRNIELLFAEPLRRNVEFPKSIHVHCDHKDCEGVRRHWKRSQGIFELGGGFSYFLVSYYCSNCLTSVKVFAVKVKRIGEIDRSGICTKIYQEPPFGQPIPKRLYHIIGEANREHFLQARRAIARGLGIGAYGYYRRIVENTKFDLVNSVLEVAKATNASAGQIELLKKAQLENQFSKAIEILRDVSAIPAVLLIDGHNPLSLLHDLLSEGIHQLDDQECLKRSQEAEVILCEIADRMQMAVSERKTVKDAMSSILNRKAADKKDVAPS